MDFSQLILAPTDTVRDAVTLIDRSGGQLGLLIDDGRLLGVVTDGDIRRGLLRGVSLDDRVTDIANATPSTVDASAGQDEIDALKRSRGVRHIPVVDDAGHLIALIGPGEGMSTELSTPVVLMAGGRGQRLYPLTRDIPKPLVPIGGVPMIEVILRRLREQGFRRMRISVNYLGDMIEKHLGDGSGLGLEIDYLHESAPLGTAGALAQLDGQMTEPFVVMNSDLLTAVDLRRMLGFHRTVADAGTVGVREYAFEIPFGVVRLEGDTVIGLAEKPEHRELVSAGIYVLEPAALALLERDQYCDMPTLLAQLIASDRSVSAYRIHEDWIDVGRPEDLERARASVEGGLG